MDDFEKNYPDFDWKNTPANKHPNGNKCRCPKHEYIREQINFTKQVNKTSSTPQPYVLSFCPDHYKVYMQETIPAQNFVIRIILKLLIRIGAMSIRKLTYMQSENCFYCKYGSGGFGKKTELPYV